MRGGATLFVLVCLVAGCGARTGLEIADRVDAGPDAPHLDAPRLDAPSFDVPPPPRPDAPLSRCFLSAPNATLRGTTPIGPIDYRYARTGFLSVCEAAQIVFSPSGLLAEPIGGMRDEPYLFVTPLGPVTGTFEVMAVLRSGGMELAAPATVRVTRYESPGDNPYGDPYGPNDFCACDPLVMEEGCPTGSLRHAEGTLTIDAPGWSLTGSFVAPQCHVLHGRCF